jgi:5-methylcytosine-specific restriction endonuclease McrA
MDLEFIARANEMAKPVWDEFRENRRLIIAKWNDDNRVKLRKLIKEYSQTEKGKLASKKRSINRRLRFKKASEGLSKQEKRDIAEFYKNCPEGYEVDHIVPIYKGGIHHLINLQYLTPEENRKKHITCEEWID